MRRFLKWGIVALALMLAPPPLYAQHAGDTYRTHEHRVRVDSANATYVWYTVLVSEGTPSTVGRSYRQLRSSFLGARVLVEVGPEPEPEPDPPAPWATGVWELSFSGQPGVLDLDAERLTLPQVGTVDIAVEVRGDVIEATFTVTGVGAGTLTLTHANGALSGSAQAGGQSVAVTGARPSQQPEPEPEPEPEPTPNPDPPSDPLPPDALYPNRPDGLRLIGRNDGSVKMSADGSAFGIDAFGPWNESGMRNVSVVDDPGNPTGSGKALRLHWPAANCCAATARWDNVRELYILLRYVIEAPFSYGHKLFYLHAPGQGASGNGVWAVRETPEGGSLRVMGGGNRWQFDARGVLSARDRELAIEFHFIAASSPGASDAQVHAWVNGVKVAESRAMSMASVALSSATWTGMEFYARANSTPTAETERLREIYIAGR